MAASAGGGRRKGRVSVVRVFQADRIKNICVHQSLPHRLEVEHSSPKDVEKAAKDFSGYDFLIYHAASKVRDAMPAVHDSFKTVTNHSLVSDYAQCANEIPRYERLRTCHDIRDDRHYTAKALCYMLGH